MSALRLEKIAGKPVTPGFENKNKVLDNEAARGPLGERLAGGRRRDAGAAHGRLFVGTARTALPDPRQNRRTVGLLV